MCNRHPYLTTTGACMPLRQRRVSVSRIAVRLVFAMIVAVSFVASGGHATASSGPPAPTPLGPTNAAQVTVPFTLSWSAVSDPSGVVAYNWQVSPSSNFSSVIEQNSTSGPTQDTVMGLKNGTYF